MLQRMTLPCSVFATCAFAKDVRDTFAASEDFQIETHRCVGVLEAKIEPNSRNSR
jgi:hypothetical protein